MSKKTKAKTKTAKRSATPAPRRIATRDTATPNRPAGTRRLVTIELTIETDLTRRELSVRSNYRPIRIDLGALALDRSSCEVQRVRFVKDSYSPAKPKPKPTPKTAKTAKRSERSPS